MIYLPDLINDVTSPQTTYSECQDGRHMCLRFRNPQKKGKYGQYATVRIPIKRTIRQPWDIVCTIYIYNHPIPIPIPHDPSQYPNFYIYPELYYITILSYPLQIRNYIIQSLYIHLILSHFLIKPNTSLECYNLLTQTILYNVFAMKKHANPKASNPAVIHQNQVKFPSSSCPGTQTFIPQRPVMIFIGSTMVPRTVNLPRTSAVCSCRSFMRMLICAR
jgi:hypothetical protein